MFKQTPAQSMMFVHNVHLACMYVCIVLISPLCAQFVEHVYEGANIREFFCKIVDCSHASKPFPSKVRMEAHLLKCHAIRLEIPDVRLAKKKMRHSKMPGRVEEVLKHEASVAFLEYTTKTKAPVASREIFMAGYMRRANEGKLGASKREGIASSCHTRFVR